MAVTRQRPLVSPRPAPVTREHSDRWGRFGVPVGVCVLVAALAQLPRIGNRNFYFWDDSAMQFVPMWHYLGERIAAGQWPLLLDTSSWMGGNLAAEALFGTWNPVNIAMYLLVSRFDDLALAAAVVKTLYLVLLALGCYLLCREYGSPRWSSSVFAVALPFAGFTLFYEASSWAAGLIAYAWIPWLWLTVRRFAHGRIGAVIPFVVAALALTVGNPYGLLAVCLVLVAMLAESIAQARRTGSPFRVPLLRLTLLRLTLLGLAIGGVVMLVWLPVVGNLAVATRASIALHNDGHLVPSLNDIFSASSPAHLPRTSTFAPTRVRVSVPVAYLAWFLVPLLPWLRWGVLREQLRVLTGPLVFAGCYLVLSLGPSDFLMFRWPMRQLEYLFLGVAVVYAVALGAGLATNHVRHRALVTGGLLLAAWYLSTASYPAYPSRYLISLALIALLVALAVRAARRGPWALVAVLQVGTALALALQLTVFPANRDVLVASAPTSVAAMRDRLPAGAGTTFQVANFTAWSNPQGTRAFLFGNLDRVTGSAAVTAYSGMGYKAFRNALCLDFRGQTCPDAYQRLWQPTVLGGAPLADLMRLQRVVVQRAVLPEPGVPPGWAVVERTDIRIVLKRRGPLPWSAGRLSWASPNLRVTKVAAGGEQAESVRLERTAGGPASVAFARLAWPGYTAELDGRPVSVREGPAGLLVADLPAASSGGQLSVHWTPPGLPLGLVCAGAGLLLAIGLSLVGVRRRPPPFALRRVKTDGFAPTGKPTARSWVAGGG